MANLANDVPTVEPDLQSVAIDQAAKFAALQAELEAERQARLDAEKRAAEEQARLAELALAEERKKREEAEKSAMEAAKQVASEVESEEKSAPPEKTEETPASLSGEPKKKKPRNESEKQRKSASEKKKPGAAESPVRKKKAAPDPSAGKPQRKPKPGGPADSSKPKQEQREGAKKRKPEGQASGKDGEKKKKPLPPGAKRPASAAQGKKGGKPKQQNKPDNDKNQKTRTNAPVTPALNALKQKTRIGELEFDEDEELHPELLKIHRQKKIMIRAIAIGGVLAFCVLFALIMYLINGRSHTKKVVVRQVMRPAPVSGGGSSGVRQSSHSPTRGEYISISRQIRHMRPQSAEDYDKIVKLWTEFVGKHKDIPDDTYVKKAKQAIENAEEAKKMYAK